MRNRYVAIVVAMTGIALLNLSWFLTPHSHPAGHNDSEYSHSIEVWVAEANFTYWFNLGWYHSEPEAETGEN